jgi:hypothetical protein
VLDIIEPKPNKMFTEAQRALVRFLRYTGGKVPCAHCGKKKSILWTQLCSFKAVDFPKHFGGVQLKPPAEAKVYPPLTGVCQTHLLAPEIEQVDENGRHASGRRHYER